MNKTKETLVTAFALFSLFFGAGNLILPPQLGFKSGGLWWLITIGFCVSAIVIPILGILAHAKLQGTIFDFGKKVSPAFSLLYSFIIYGIAISLPSPRTASVTHEMAIAPFFDSPAWVTSVLYFILVFVFVINRSNLLNLIGKLLTPGIILILLLLIGIITFGFDYSFPISQFKNPFTTGILEGYQTFDAIGAVVVGGVIIISINLKHKTESFENKKRLISQAGILAGIGLFLIYMDLILSGALVHNSFEHDISRTELLTAMSSLALGNYGNLLLSILVSLACFTTAIGIITGTADFIASRFPNFKNAYLITAIVGSLLGVIIGQFNVGYIIVVAIPVLALIYPVTIILIFLNVLPNTYASPKVFKWVVGTTILFSLPDFVHYGLEPMYMGFDGIRELFSWLPLINDGLGWVLPAFMVFITVNLFSLKPNLK
ncbi:branched-chain amino acid transport system II carrier protein [Maribacter sp. CXY002]|uniref:branched-chain amino acid transport system II carrier protein n=1 Tax=Maribacter luteocoastalis TaxID=3407671 RepID=UPI003B66C3B9